LSYYGAFADLGRDRSTSFEAGANRCASPGARGAKRVNRKRCENCGAVAALLAAGFGTGRASAADVVHFAWPQYEFGLRALFVCPGPGFFRRGRHHDRYGRSAGAGTIIPQIVNGSITTGFITLSPLIVARQPGGPNFDIQVRLLTSFLPRFGNWRYSRKARSRRCLTSPGKTIGVGALNFGNIPLTKALLAAQAFVSTAINFSSGRARRTGLQGAPDRRSGRPQPVRHHETS